MDYIQQQTVTGYSNECMTMAADVTCSICDADIGTQRRHGLCVDYCHRWYQACSHDLFIEVGETNTDLMTLEFCLDEEVTDCVSLQSLEISSQMFCHRMGY